MQDVVEAVEARAAQGERVGLAVLVRTERSSPKTPGALMAFTERGEIIGSLTGGCIEPALYEEAKTVLAGAAPRIARFGIAHDDAFEVGLPCGGGVEILVGVLEPALARELASAVREKRPVALAVWLSGKGTGRTELISGDNGVPAGVRELLRSGTTGTVDLDGDEVFVRPFLSRPRMYVFGAIDFASSVAWVGRFLGYHVTVCDARSRFVTRERFPDADELVVEWPDRFLERAPVDERTTIVVLTHDDKFDLPTLRIALRTRAGYVGAMGSRRTTERRAELLRNEGLTDAELARLHAPIGLPIASRSPEEVAVAIGAEIIAEFVTRRVALPTAH